MAANYWESTQRRYWEFSKDELAHMREKLEEEEQTLVHMFPLPQWRQLNIYFNQQILRLGKRIGARQQAVATAQMYMKRFYCKVEIRRTNPYLLMATALYLACKMEECPQHIRMVMTEARALWSDFANIDVQRMGECEFFLISEMHSQLIVHQPYRTLITLQSDFHLSQDEANAAWSIINDHYMTDLPLLYPPHLVALTAILLALTVRSNSQGGGPAGGIGVATATLAQAQAQAQAQARINSGIGGPMANGNPQQATGPTDAKDKQVDTQKGKLPRFAHFLAESNVDVEGMVDCTQELISYYECHEQYDDKMTREQINRYVKARGLDKP